MRFGLSGATACTAEGINSVTHPAHLAHDGNVAFQPVTRELLFTSHTLFFFFLAELIFTLAVIFRSQFTSSFSLFWQDHPVLYC